MTRKQRNTVLQVPAIENGTVIDHIPSHAALTVVKILSDLDDLVTIGINLASRAIGKKGVVKIANRQLSPSEVAKIALIAPEATLSIIESYEVVRKTKVSPPAVVEGIARCGNPNCVTNHERISTRFTVTRDGDDRLCLTCHWCERSYEQKEIEVL